MRRALARLSWLRAAVPPPGRAVRRGASRPLSHARSPHRGTVAQAEVLGDESGDVPKRPLLAQLRGSRLKPAEKQWPQRVTRGERAMASPAGVARAAPVDALVTRREGDDHVAGVRRIQRRPQAR